MTDDRRAPTTWSKWAPPWPTGDSAIPLRCVYVFENAQEPRIDDIRRTDGLVALVRHTFAPFPLTTSEARAAHFRQCAAIAATVPVRRLSRPRDFVHLRRLTEMIELDAAHV